MMVNSHYSIKRIKSQIQHFIDFAFLLIMINQTFYFFIQPELGAGKLTVGKIYAGLLVLENWRTTRFGTVPGSGLAVSCCTNHFALLINIIISYYYHIIYLFILFHFFPIEQSNF